MKKEHRAQYQSTTVSSSLTSITEGYEGAEFKGYTYLAEHCPISEEAVDPDMTVVGYTAEAGCIADHRHCQCPPRGRESH